MKRFHLPTQARLAEILGVHRGTPKKWKDKNKSIPAEYHKKILALAKRRGVELTKGYFYV